MNTTEISVIGFPYEEELDGTEWKASKICSKGFMYSLGSSSDHLCFVVSNESLGPSALTMVRQSLSHLGDYSLSLEYFRSHVGYVRAQAVEFSSLEALAASSEKVLTAMSSAAVVSEDGYLRQIVLDDVVYKFTYSGLSGASMEDAETPEKLLTNFAEEVKGLCSDFSSRGGNVYIKDVQSAIDSLLELYLEGRDEPPSQL